MNKCVTFYAEGTVFDPKHYNYKNKKIWRYLLESNAKNPGITLLLLLRIYCLELALNLSICVKNVQHMLPEVTYAHLGMTFQEESVFSTLES